MDDARGAADDLTGREIAGRYRVVGKLGEGAMGAVYLGEHLKIGRLDAIKVLRAELSSDREAMARFTRGARNVSAIRHPNVCTIYDFGDTADGLQFLAMEYVEGHTLKEILEREGTLPPARAVAIAAQAAEALQAAHDAGIVHRDLKPANIMVATARDGTDVVKVVDFDIAKGSAEGVGAEVTRLGFVVGTPEYMSPEQLIGDALDGRSDLYSLALVLFRMLTGALPFRATGTQELMIERLTQPPLRLDEVGLGGAPAALQDELDAALRRNVGERTASASAFARGIRAALGEPAAAVAARQAPAAEQPRAAAPPDARADLANVPPTRVVPPPAAAAAERPREQPSRRWLAPAGLGAAAIIALIVVYGLRDAPDEDVQPAPADPVDVAGPAETDPVQPAGDATEPEVVVVDPPADSVTAPDPTQPQRDPPAGGGMTAAETSALLTSLLDRLSGDPPPGPAALRDMRDRAMEAYGLGERIPARDRALAAFIVANAAIELDRTDEIVPWLERAVRLAPEDAAYRRMLDAYRRQSP